MSERDGFDPGVPCWTDHSSPDAAAAAAFYSGLFGWETEEQMPPDAPGSYLACRLRGRDVAAIGSQMTEGAPATWTTYVWVESADNAAAKVSEAGGTVLAEPFDVFDAGRMAAFADPAGAAISVWQAGMHRGAQIVNEHGTLTWNELMTRDPEGAKRFYGDVFGWRAASMDYDGGEYTVWNPPGEGEPSMEQGIGGMMPMVGDQWPADLPPHWMTYFAVDDSDATSAKVEGLGGKVSVAPFDTPVGRIAVLNDPQGAVFSVLKLAMPGR